MKIEIDDRGGAVDAAPLVCHAGKVGYDNRGKCGAMITRHESIQAYQGRCSRCQVKGSLGMVAELGGPVETIEEDAAERAEMYWYQGRLTGPYGDIR